MLPKLWRIIFTIWRSGISNFSLYILLGLTILLNISKTALPDLPWIKFLDLTDVLILTILGQLLYLKLEKKHPDYQEAVPVFPTLQGSKLKEMMSEPGHKVILNSYIYNYSDIAIDLKEAIKDDQTKIEFNILNPESDFVRLREEEMSQNKPLKRDLKNAIEQCKIDLSNFLSNLTIEQKSRVKVFEYYSMPKVTIYGSNNRALIGIFLPNRYVAETPHLLLENQNGSLDKEIWAYYHNIGRKDITEN